MSSDETTALLIRARGFIERGWCRKCIARNDTGSMVSATADEAVAWCAEGALIAAGVTRENFFKHPAYRQLHRAVGGDGYYDIGTFNDAQETAEPVLAAFDRAIAMGVR